MEFLHDRPPPSEAIHNVYELKTQPELVQYYHAAAGFPTKPSWLKDQEQAVLVMAGPHMGGGQQTFSRI
jgi:hypothetical protein